MRLHRLEAQAFGPFAERVAIDLDELGTAGLFLVHGPTGSGKTSLLDAVCFALYADVPGARSKRGLRSDHAAPDAIPQVVLELTAGGRRLRVTRSPEWQRPKRRGTGTRKVQASVLLEERVGGRWAVVATRHDEVALVVDDLLAMGLRQFAQVVLLPQGEFAAFLRATPEDRRAVLEHLFDIGVFSDVELWLADTRRTTTARLDAARSALGSELLRLDDLLAEALVPAVAAGAVLADPAVEEPVLEEAGLAATPSHAVPSRLAAVARMLDQRLTAALTEADAADAADEAAAAALARGRATAAARARGAQAADQLALLDAGAAAQRDRVVRLGAAERAAATTGHAAAYERSRAEVRAAAVDLESARAAVTRRGLDDDPGHASDLAARLHTLDDTVAELARHAASVANLAHHLDETSARRAEAALDEQQTVARLTEVLAELAGAEAEIPGLAGAPAEVARLRLLLAACDERLGVHEQLELDQSGLERLTGDVMVARDTVLARQERLLTARQARLDGMAAELAARLAPGVPCPVCGSEEHPATAEAARGAVTADDVAAAEVDLDLARTALGRLDERVAALRAAAGTRRAALDGADRATTQSERERTHAALADAESAVAELAARRESVVALRTRADTARTIRAGLTATLAALDTRVDELTAEAAAAASGLRSCTAAHQDCPCGSTAHGAHAAAGRVLDHLDSASRAASAAGRRAADAREAYAAAAVEQGFASLDSAAEALLPWPEMAALREAVTAHDSEVATARAILEEPEVAEALAGTAPDVRALEFAAAQARRTVLTAAAARDATARSHTALLRTRPGLEAACDEVVRLADRDAAVRELADTVGGTGPDNTLRMRLSAFVLAARLEKIVALANERLTVLGDGRYLLEHSDERAARGARSGLGLRVLDQWTGRSRDTASLSGGESFMASLALALGLADAVREESGGLDLGTLFVDEGFGSLDDDSLEQVVAVLDGLREGGRAVGVVSHVADLRSRITAQVVVHKDSGGSTVEVRTGVGSAA
ncbi:MAG: AAA family ATPase [Phycicoccus sp.]